MKNQDKYDLLFIVRIHNLDSLRKRCINKLTKQFNDCEINSKKIVYICHRSDQPTKDFLNKNDCIFVEEQSGTNSVGAEMTKQHYTLYSHSMEVAKKYSHNDTVIFFIEDDYIFRPDAFKKCYNFAKKYKNDIIAPFDHPDRYKEEMRRMENNARDNFLLNKDFKVVHGGIGSDINIVKAGYINYKLDIVFEYEHHWRTVISTCHTFVCSFNALKQTEPFLYNADRQRGDHIMWTAIWSKGIQRVWSPTKGLARHMGHNPEHELLNDYNDWSSV